MRKVCLALGLLAILPFSVRAVDDSGPAVAAALILDQDGEEIGGAMLLETQKGILLEMDIVGLEPGEFAFHIHETGACVPPNFESSGEHFNAAGMEHGALNSEGPHLGDMDNLVVGWDGTAHVVRFLPDVQLTNGAYSLLVSDGASLVIHSEPDDYKSNPDGDSGKRIACGVIELVETMVETE